MKQLMTFALIIWASIAFAQDCIISVAKSNGDTLLLQTNSIRYVSTRDSIASIVRGSNFERVATSEKFDTIVARAGNLLEFTDAQNGFSTAVNKAQILEIRQMATGKASIITQWGAIFRTTENYSAIKTLAETCTSASPGGSASLPYKSYVASIRFGTGEIGTVTVFNNDFTTTPTVEVDFFTSGVIGITFNASEGIAVGNTVVFTTMRNFSGSQDWTSQVTVDTNSVTLFVRNAGTLDYETSAFIQVEVRKYE